MRSMFLPLLGLVATVLNGCSINIGWREPAVWAESTEQFDVASGQLDRLALITYNGAVTVSSGTAGDEMIHVTAVKRAGGDDDAEAHAALAALNVARRTDAGTLEIEAERQASGWSDSNSSIRFDVTLPARFAARIESQNGAIRVDGISGSLDVLSHNGRLEIAAPARHVVATTHNGAVAYRGPAEEIAIETHNGAIEAALTGGAISGRLGTHNGAIRITAADSVRGTLEGETQNGSVSIHAESNRCTIRDDWFRLEFREPAAGRLEVTTQNGAIEVR